MQEILLTVTLLIWIPVIPLRLAIQGGIGLWRRLGDFSYAIFLIYWAGVDILILANWDRVSVSYFETFPFAAPLGYLLIAFGLLLGYWTSHTLGLVILSTRAQVHHKKVGASLMVSGPYNYLRHPFYFAEWFALLGLSLVTQSYLVLGLLVLALILDPIVTFFEEKELVERFGNAYREYQKKVPRLLPTFSQKT